MLEVKNVSKEYNQHFVLNNVNLTLTSGEVVALVGENGAGKSTLMRIITGYIPPTSGGVLIYGKDISTHRIAALSHIGYVPEISTLYGDMTVYKFLLWIAHLWKIDDADSAILSALENMQITDVLTQRIDTLSKGYKKRVEIAGAILHNPDILILDEPTDGLDPNQKVYIRDFLKTYAKKKTVLLSTHVLEDVDGANRIIMLAKGNVIKDSPIKDFKKDAKAKTIADAFHYFSKHLEENK